MTNAPRIQINAANGSTIARTIVDLTPAPSLVSMLVAVSHVARTAWPAVGAKLYEFDDGSVLFMQDARIEAYASKGEFENAATM